MTNNQRIAYIALLSAHAVIIGLFERAIPFPFAFAPGAKIGLANIITLMALYTLPVKDTFKVIVLRLILATLFGGTLSTFMYAAMGAVFSFLSMCLVKKSGSHHVSLIGVSVTGAIFHHIGQLVIAAWVAGTWTVFLYLPVLSFIGIFAGIATGIIANHLLVHVEKLNHYFHLHEMRKTQEGKGERDEAAPHLG